MKKCCLSFVLILLVVAMVTGCGKAADAEAPATEAPAVENTTAATEAPTEEATEAPTEEATEAPTEEATEAPTEEATEAPTEEATEAPTEEATEAPAEETDPVTYYTDVVYAEQIGRYYKALSEKWEEGDYFDNEMSALPYYYYDGDPLENVGFSFVDLDNDGNLELVIGAIKNAKLDPSVFEIWTLVDGKPVMLVQGGSRNRYVMQYVEEDGMWYVVNEASSSAANHATYYLMLSEGKFEVVQGIVFDAMADEQNPWFMSYDLDWDTSNDEPIDQETAEAILESKQRFYTALEYIPYTAY